MLSSVLDQCQFCVVLAFLFCQYRRKTYKKWIQCTRQFGCLPIADFSEELSAERTLLAIEQSVEEVCLEETKQNRLPWKKYLYVHHLENDERRGVCFQATRRLHSVILVIFLYATTDTYPYQSDTIIFSFDAFYIAPDADIPLTCRRPSLKRFKHVFACVQSLLRKKAGFRENIGIQRQTVTDGLF